MTFPRLLFEHTGVVLLFSRAACLERRRSRKASSKSRPISRSFTILYDLARIKKKRLLKVKSRKAIGRAVKGGNLPFITTLMLCLSVEDVVASAPGFDRSLHRSNARREIHGRMTIDPFQTSDRSIDRIPSIIYH